MEFFVYGRDRPGSNELRWQVTEKHWSFMDGYADAMIARGPTFEGDQVTGSVHIVDLPDGASAHRFAVDEPYHRAGVFAQVLVRRWHNVLGRTMWQFADAVAGYRRFLVLGHGLDGHRDDYEHLPTERFIALGPLLSDDGKGWLGTAALVEVPTRHDAAVLLPPEHYDRIEVHSWRFGGGLVPPDPSRR